MKTIRLTVIALMAALLAEVAMAPVPAAAGAPASGPCVLGTNANRCLTGNFTFRLASAKSFTASLAADGDPANVSGAPLQSQSLVRAGAFNSNGMGGLLGHTQTTVTDQSGKTELVNYTWGGSYTLNGDMTGTLTIIPASASAWTCTDTTVSPPTSGPCVGNEVGTETYALSVSSTYTLMNMIETDNNTAVSGAKIFMAGQAIKR